MELTPAHDQKTTIHLLEHIPDHAPREGDPNYHIFHATRKRMIEEGKGKCFIGNHECGGQLEWHHVYIEFSQLNAVDLELWNKVYPQFAQNTVQALREWAETEANMLVLCKVHHTGRLGIHSVPVPLWGPQAFELKAPCEVVKPDAAK